jgi:hypothetical protein
MPAPANITKAKLEQIRLADGNRAAEVTNQNATLVVPFNPESLKVTYSNTVSGGDQSGGAAIQQVSKSSTKLAVELWFDVSAVPGTSDVRKLTNKVNYFFVPIRQGNIMAPPAVRFSWGSFLFEGVMQSMDETIEYFSADGRPLRSKVSISIVSQDIQSKINEITPSGGLPGTRPQLATSGGEGLQQLLGRSGSPEGWQAVALANGIENPRLLEAGAFIDPVAAQSFSGPIGRG